MYAEVSRVFKNSKLPIIDIKVTFARNLAKKLSPLFYSLILLFQLSVPNLEKVLKIRKEKTGVSPTSLASQA